MKKTVLLLPTLPLLLAGCQTIKAHNPFRHKPPEYQGAQQEAPLEVPPGIDQPATSDALAIPNAGAAGESTQPAGAGATGSQEMTPPAAGMAPNAEGGAAISGSSLALADTLDSAYRRVGLALERGGVGTVTSHDDAAHTYQVAVNTVVTEKSRGGFIHRLFHHGHTETVTGTVTVAVVPQGNGSRVDASGNPDAVARVLAVIHQRLQ
jgi:uncharacterized lipoprotein